MKAAVSNLRFQTTLKAILFCVITTGLLKLLSILSSKISALSNGFLSSGLAATTTLLITFIFLRFDRKRFSEIGLRFEVSSIWKFAIGFFVGFLVVALLINLVILLAGYKIQTNSKANLIFLLTYSLPVTFLLAFMEEVAFRGYPLVTLNKGSGVAIAIVITSVLFGIYHLVLGWGIAGFTSTSIWGIWFAAFAIYSRGIAMPAGVHTSMNLTQAIFGLTANPFSIWNIVDKSGMVVTDFSGVQVAVTVAQVALVLIAVFFLRLLSKKL